jgi:hypothetical protein
LRSIKQLAYPVAIAALAIAGPANAARPSTVQPMNCWGVVSAQLAQVEGGLGEHSSSQSSPRSGLGNVARLFYDLGFIEEPTLNDLGAFLASLDEYDDTVCPIQG